jgi:hypothetical protein
VPLIGDVSATLGTYKVHIENRRLFNLAAGRLRLETWELEHFHECKVCKGVLYVFLNQVIGSIENQPEAGQAA